MTRLKVFDLSHKNVAEQVFFVIWWWYIFVIG